MRLATPLSPSLQDSGGHSHESAVGSRAGLDDVMLLFFKPWNRDKILLYAQRHVDLLYGMDVAGG